MILDSLLVPAALPNQNLNDKEIKEIYGKGGQKAYKEFYRQSAMYYSQFYNQINPLSVNKTTIGYSSDVEQIKENFLFFQGKQQNTNFYFMQQGFDGSNVVELPIPFMPGQETGAIIRFLSGQFLGIAASIKPSVRVLNPELKSKMTKELKKVEVMRNMKEYLDFIKEQTGYELKSPVDITGSTEEITQKLYHKIGTKIQVDASNLAKYITEHSMNIMDLKRGFENVNIGRRLVTHDNGDGTFKILPPWTYFSVSADDDDRGKYDSCRGIVNYISRADALYKYQKTMDENELKQLRDTPFLDQSWWTPFVQSFNYTLYDNENEICSLVRVYWKSTVDTKIVIKENELGEKEARRLKANSKQKGEMVQIVRYCDILCGHIVADYGIYDIISDENELGNRLFPVMVFQPNFHLGFNQSIVDNIKDIQKEMDAINFRVRENYTMDLGTVLAINGKKLKDGVGAKQLYQMLRTNKIHVTTASGEADDPVDKEPTFYREDVSLMRDIEQYLKLYEAKNQKVNEITNTSSITRGIQTQYVGKMTQQSSIAQATNSVQYNVVGTLQTFTDAANFALNQLVKKIQKDPTNSKWENLLGEDGVKRLLDLKDKPYSKMHLTIDLQDTIPEERRARILAHLDRLMAGGQIDFEDYMNVEDATNITELKEFSKYSVKKRQFAAQQQAYADAVSRQNAAETIAQGNQTGREIEATARMESEKIQSATGLAKTAMQQGATPEDAAQIIQGMNQSQGQPQGQPQPQEQMM